jgi:pimeloyl-ACP methyl ester carboxylesterase
VRTETIDVGGPLHVADFGGRGPVMVLLHGLGGSHLNWMRLGPLLAERARVYAPDMAGFGRTPPAGRSTSVFANQRLLDRFLEEVAGTPAILVGNSMGGMISILEAAARPDRVAGLILLSPAIPIAPGVPRERQVTISFATQMVPGLGESFVRRRLARLGPEGIIRESFEVCCTDPSRIPQEVVDAHVDLVRWRSTQPWANAGVLQASRSMIPLMLRRRRYHRVLQAVEAPTLLVQGMDDRLVTLASVVLLARRRPDWTLKPLPGVGHIPHLEDPDVTASVIWEWLEGPGRPALQAAASSPAPDVAAGPA